MMVSRIGLHCSFYCKCMQYFSIGETRNGLFRSHRMRMIAARLAYERAKCEAVSRFSDGETLHAFTIEPSASGQMIREHPVPACAYTMPGSLKSRVQHAL